MKNACISVRNISASYDGSAVGAVVTALTAGGYTADKIFLLDDADEREFAQTVIECKNFFENVFLVVPPQRVTAYTAQAAGLLKCEPMPVMESGQKSFFVIPYGEEGSAPFWRKCCRILKRSIHGGGRAPFCVLSARRVSVSIR